MRKYEIRRTKHELFSFYFVVRTLYLVLMWICPLCNQQFIKSNQQHSCNDKVLADFLKGKTEHTLSLFKHFTNQYQKIGKVTVHPTKSMIAIAARTRMAYITRLGKNFVDIVFPFDRPYTENLCFHKIARVPGTQQFNHHFRMCALEDLNEELMGFMQLAYDEHSGE
jgi:hypothetical protein